MLALFFMSLAQLFFMWIEFYAKSDPKYPNFFKLRPQHDSNGNVTQITLNTLLKPCNWCELAKTLSTWPLTPTPCGHYSPCRTQDHLIFFFGFCFLRLVFLGCSWLVFQRVWPLHCFLPLSIHAISTPSDSLMANNLRTALQTESVSWPRGSQTLQHMFLLPAHTTFMTAHALHYALKDPYQICTPLEAGWGSPTSPGDIEFSLFSQSLSTVTSNQSCYLPVIKH